MMTSLFLFLSWIFLICGLIGLLKHKATFSRLLIAGLVDTMAAISILFALITYQIPAAVRIKLILLLLFIMITNPVTIHSITRAYYLSVDKHLKTPEERRTDHEN